MSDHFHDVAGAEITVHGLNLPARLKASSWGDFLTGVVEHFIPGEIVVATERPIAPETDLTVEVHGCVLDGEVLLCCPRANAYEVHISIKDSEVVGYRRTPRFIVRIPARVFNSGLKHPLTVMIVDISGDGIGLEATSDIPLEAAVAVESEANIALGTVRYSHQQSAELYRIGVKIHHVLPRSDQDQHPHSLGNLLSFARKK